MSALCLHWNVEIFKFHGKLIAVQGVYIDMLCMCSICNYPADYENNC
jgi:hypothetical protein